jgi:hypothetical protein
MRVPLSYAAIADGSGLNWDCWPKGTAWKYGPDFCISPLISMSTVWLAGRLHWRGVRPEVIAAVAADQPSELESQQSDTGLFSASVGL